jgi:dienelactone hydrolase
MDSSVGAPAGRDAAAPGAEELVTASAEDGVALDGLLVRPEGGGRRAAVVWVHGFGANFCFPPYLRLARALATQGVASVVANTRGHDLGTFLHPRGRPPYWGGGLWELLDEAPRDLAGWVDFVVRAGFRGAVLLGHSLGAVKVTHYLAQRRDPRVHGLALASPPLRPSWDTRAHPAALAEARELVAAGRPEALFAGPWGPVSAQTYLGFDRVGFDQFGRSTDTPGLASVACPVFAVIGAHDEHVCTPAELAVIEQNATAAPRVESHVVAGADHFFGGHEGAVAMLLGRWVGALDTPATWTRVRPFWAADVVEG